MEGGWQPPQAPGPETPPAPAQGWQPPALADPASANLAGWGERAGATLLDLLLYIAVSFAFGFMIGVVLGVSLGAADADDSSINIAANGVGAVVGFAVYATYTGLLMTRSGERNGQTLGKQALGIRVVRADGQPLTLGTVAVRHWVMKYVVFLYVAILTLYIATLLNYLWPLWDRENRALHDMVASTRVVKA